MKTILLLISCLIFLYIAPANLFCSDLKIDLRYVNDENSKHSHGSELNISVSGYNVSYSIINYGNTKNSAIAFECTFNEQDILNLESIIVSKRLNVTDSLVDESYSNKDFQNTSLISLNISMNDLPSIISLKGNTKVLELSDLYKNSMSFIDLLRQLANDRR